MNDFRAPIRHFNYTIAAGYNFLTLVSKGDKVTAGDAAKAGLVTGLQIAAIYYSDKAIAAFVRRGWLARTTGVLAGVQLAYIAGATAAVAIDEKEGFQNYNDFIDDVTSGEIGDAGIKFQFALTVLLSRWAFETESGKTTVSVIEELKRINFLRLTIKTK